MNLSKEFVDRYTEKAKGSSIYGVEFKDLSKEELLAVAVQGWSKYDALLQENLKRKDWKL